MMTPEMSTDHRKLAALIVFLTTAICTATSAFVGDDIEYLCDAPSQTNDSPDSQGGAVRKIA